MKKKELYERDVVVKILWLDACLITNQSLEDILDTPAEDLLVPTLTYGRLMREDSKVYVVASFCNEQEEYDCMVIPKSWVNKIQYLKGGK